MSKETSKSRRVRWKSLRVVVFGGVIALGLTWAVSLAVMRAKVSWTFAPSQVSTVSVDHGPRDLQYEDAREGLFHGLLNPTTDDNSTFMIPLELQKENYLGRTIPDFRHGSCKNQDYKWIRESLVAKLSVVIIFCNEPQFNLLRTIHSVLDKTPAHILKEIVLVDDGSNAAHIVGDDSFVARYTRQLPKVRLIRNPSRTGIVGARLLGISASTGRVFAMLDSHVELTTGWAEPLVNRVLEDNKRIVMPTIDAIERGVVTRGGIGCVLGILWRMVEHSFPPSDLNPLRMNLSPTDYVSSPAMAGGIFAADRDVFLAMGGYDPGITFWGVENLELSIRWWQCGGTIECTECSRVAHIFGGFRGYQSMQGASVERNKLRTMAVWMDEFANLSWQMSGKSMMDVGDLSDRLTLRKELNCKSFKWFVENVWPEADVHDVLEDVPYYGVLRHIESKKCLTTTGAMIQLRNCDNPSKFIYFRRPGRITTAHDEEKCFTFSENHRALRGAVDTVKVITCHEHRPKFQSFDVVKLDDGATSNSTSLTIQATNTESCLSIVNSSPDVKLIPCNDKDMYQIWEWEKFKIVPLPWQPQLDAFA